MQQEPGQRGAHLPAARERRRVAAEVPRIEAEAGEDALGAMAAVPLLEVVELGVDVGERLRQLELLVVVGRLVQRLLGRGEPGLHGAAPGHRGEHHLDERAGRQRGHVLGQVPGARAAPPGEGPRVGAALAGEDAQE